MKIQKTQTHNCKQIQIATNYITEFYNQHKDRFHSTEGVTASEIYNGYLLLTNFPMGYKSFFPILHTINVVGGQLERVMLKGKVTYVYMAELK